MMMMMMLCY